jgi:hypothetical protein
MAQTLLGFIVFVVLVVLGLDGLQAGGSVPQAVIIMLSAAVGLGVWRAQENARHARDLESKLVTDKTFLYKVYLDVLRELFEKGTDKRVVAGLMKKLNAFVFGSLLIASDDVVLAHDRFMRASTISEEMVLPAVADVILAMRRDAGKTATNLRPIDVLAAFVKDIETLAPAFDRWAKEGASVWPVAAAPSQGKTR